MKNLVFFTFFLILITFSVHQNAIAEIEGDEERKKAAQEAVNKLKRTIEKEETKEESIEKEEEPKSKQKLGKLKKFLPTEDEFDEITLLTVWKYVDKRTNSDNENGIESIQGLLRDVGRVYDPVVNKYKIATLQIEIIKYEDKVSLEN